MNFEEQRAVTPNGSQTLSKRAEAFLQPHYPQYCVAGEGCYLIVEKGKRHIDLNGGLGSVTIGYGEPPIVGNLQEIMNQGVSLSLPSALEGEASNVFVRHCPWIDQVRFVKTGSEATEAAVRIARIATGREPVLTLTGHYHGWHHEFQAYGGYNEGTLRASAWSMDQEEEDLSLIKDALSSRRYAAIILEPAQFTYNNTRRDFLLALRSACDDVGTLLIYDEMLTGFRESMFGIAELSGVYPDLSTYGKCLAQGLPLACVAGRAELMQHAWVVSGTFGGDRVSLQAFINTFEFYQRNDLCNVLIAAGDSIKQELCGIFALGFHVEGRARLKFSFSDDTFHHKLWSFLVGCLRHGLFVHPSGINLMYRSVNPIMLPQVIQRLVKALDFVAKGGLTSEEMAACIAPQPAWREGSLNG